jgi:uncharacterized Tic20 family protein
MTEIDSGQDVNGKSQSSDAKEAGRGGAESASGEDGELSTEEKTWGMLAHLLAFLGAVGVPFGSLVGPAIAYFVQKDKSRFVRFHAIQSFAFQLCLGIVGILMIIPTIVLYILTVGLVLIVVIPLGIALAIALVVYVIRIALKANEGECARYHYIGDWVYRRVYEEDWKPL